MKIWVGSPVDVLHDDDASKALMRSNDSKYWDDNTGIVRIDNDRWRIAQQFESDGWLKYWTAARSDRNHEHKALFGDYTCVPSELGNVIEIGCGPFTQVCTICDTRKYDSITLLDPLLDKYVDHNGCAYKNGTMMGRPVTLICDKAENLDIVGRFDTAICINVLEHVQDALVVLDNLYKCLVVGGIVIFGERFYDGLDINSIYDVGHPIRVKRVILDEWAKLFDMRYEYISNSDNVLSNEFYFIGVKK